MDREPASVQCSLEGRVCKPFPRGSTLKYNSSVSYGLAIIYHCELSVFVWTWLIWSNTLATKISGPNLALFHFVRSNELGCALKTVANIFNIYNMYLIKCDNKLIRLILSFFLCAHLETAITQQQLKNRTDTVLTFSYLKLHHEEYAQQQTISVLRSKYYRISTTSAWVISLVIIMSFQNGFYYHCSWWVLLNAPVLFIHIARRYVNICSWL